MSANCPCCGKPPTLEFKAQMAYDDYFYECWPCEVTGPHATDADEAEEAWDQWTQTVKN